MLTPEDLTAEQLAWAPTSYEEAFSQWPNGHKIEVWEGVLQYFDGVPLDGGWDWRSVALAARAYPGARVVLHHPGRLSVEVRGSRPQG